MAALARNALRAGTASALSGERSLSSRCDRRPTVARRDDAGLWQALRNSSDASPEPAHRGAARR